MADEMEKPTASPAPVPLLSLKPPFTARSIPPSAHAHSNVDVTASQASLSATGNIGQQPFLETATTIPLAALDSLPTIAGRQDDTYLVNDDIAKFLDYDLDLSRLNRIHRHLWAAGRPMRARPLHRYKMLGFDILHTQQMDLHLLKFSDHLMVKPLAEYMLDYSFWTEWICERPGGGTIGDWKEERRRELWRSGAGFLLSWVWLVTTPLDLKVAHDHVLLPSFVTWHWWKAFVRDFISHVDINALDQVNKRFHYGDLRLGRINTVYRTRYAHTHFVRGYLYGYNRYVVFFQRKFGWILIVFVFFSLVLAAMQVGASVNPLESNVHFLRTCYIFVVFSMLAVLVVLVIVALVFVFIYLFNMGAAIRHSRKMRAERKRKALERGVLKDV